MKIYPDGKRRVNPLKLYCVLGTISFLLLILCFFFSHGELIEQYFFYDTRDTGMDFFHSIEYVRGKKPYLTFNTLYPPLANLFFGLFFRMIPISLSDNWPEDFYLSIAMRGTEYDLRTYQSCMIWLILFIVACVWLMSTMLELLAGPQKRTYLKWSVLCALTSYGTLYALERGNVILMNLPLLVFFVYFRRSKHPVLKELALIALAIVAGFKLYPAFFGILLLRDKDYKAAARAVVYGVAAIVLPFFAFEEKLSGFRIWLNVLLNFEGDTSTPAWTSSAFSTILLHLTKFVCDLTGREMPEPNYSFLGWILAAALLVLVFFLRKEWQRNLAIVLAITMCSAQADYIYILFLIPLFLFIRQEHYLDAGNAVPFAMLMVLTLPLPLFYIKNEFYPKNTLSQVALVVTVIWCFASACKYDALNKKGENGEQPMVKTARG